MMLASHPGNILIVEDDKFMSITLEMILKTEGYNVKTLNDGKSAINNFKEKLPDLLLLDYNLSGLNGVTGLAVYQKAKEIKPSVKAIMISAYGDKKIKEMAKKSGINHFLDKPFVINNLIKQVKKLLKN